MTQHHHNNASHAAPGGSAGLPAAGSPVEVPDPMRAGARAAALGQTAAVLDGLLDAVDAGELDADTVSHAYVMGARDALRLAVE